MPNDVKSEVNGQYEKTHGLCGTREHNSWKQLRQRCNNPKDPSYHRYGGRGIKVCERWGSFENFLQDMGQCPEGKKSIDRVDNNGDYEPLNCRWATNKEQSQNRRTNSLIEFRGEVKCISQWAEEIGIQKATIRARLQKGWTVEKTLTAPARTYSKCLKYPTG